MPNEKLPPMCVKDAEPDRFKIFATLRERWKNEEDGRTYAALAAHLGCAKQQVSQWATASGGKSPAPWSLIMVLCHELSLGVAVEPEGIKLYRIAA